MALLKKFLRDYHIERIDLPFELKINFKKAFDYWKEIANGKDTPKSKQAQYILDSISHAKELKKDILDFDVLEKYAKEIEILLSDFFPSALQSNEVKACTIPFIPLFYNLTTRFKNLLKNVPDGFDIDIRGVEFERMYIYSCTFILNALFGLNIDYKRPLFLDLPNKNTGLTRNFRVFFNADFAEFKWNNSFKQPTQSQLKELKDNFDDIEVWKRIIPKGSVEINGFTIMSLQDVTTDDILSNIKNILIEKNALQNSDVINQLEQYLKEYFSIPDIKMGFSLFDVKGESIDAIGRDNAHSLIMHGKKMEECDKLYCDYSFNLIFKSGRPIAISELNTDPIRNAEFAKNLISQNFNSYIVSPILEGEQIIGLFEIASPTKGVLNSILTSKLDDLLPLFTIAVSRMREEHMTKLEALIQEKYTAIHPSVAWKFFEEASGYLGNPDKEVGDISFTDVYPIYGQADIKGSSLKRNESIQLDLIEQLEMAKYIVNKASITYGFPIYEVLIYKIDNFIKAIKDHLNAGDEVKVLSFLNREIKMSLEHIQKNHKEMVKDVEEYYEKLDPNLGLVYNKRKEYDDSVTKLNESISKVLVKSQEGAQDMFPHYFQHYKTDGVEYNIYAGDSLVSSRTFDKLHLKNLRIWQLITSYRIERKAHKLKKKLPVPLEICSLILVHSTPLAIKFRMDEKQFDVDGAYNIRYEIVKKRIDKALIKGTSERLTVPGKIAIVYSQDSDKEEYLVYLEYLRSIKLIKGKIEEHILEDLKGASGLKALRVTVNLTENTKVEAKEIEKLIENISN